MATTRRPPVIPEIAKAYQNDPRTMLARQSMAAGTSGAPVAEGKYAYMDGLARVLTGLSGAYGDRKSMERYAGDEAELLAARKKRGVEGLTGAPAIPLPQPAPATTQAPPQAAAVAEALGAPPPQAPQTPAMPIEGGGQVQPPFGLIRAASGAPSLRDGVRRLTGDGARVTSGYRTPKRNAEVGGVSNSYHTRGSAEDPQAYDLVPRAGETMAQLEARTRRELPGHDVINEGDHVHVEPSSGARSASPVLAGGPGADTLEPVPEAPKPMARPNAPEAVGPTRSKMLDAAYRIMQDANPYESASGQEMYVSGLADQSKMDEAATERLQRIRDMGYQSDLGMYSDAQSQDRGNAYQERRDVLGRNHQSGEAAKDRTFRAGESALDREQREWETRFGADTQKALQSSSQAFQAGESALDRGLTREIKGADTKDQARQRAQTYFTTKDGQKFLQSNQDAVNQASRTIEVLDAFDKRLAETKRTGGGVLGNAPGLVKWSNTDLQILDGLTNELALGRATEMKGSLSDKDVKFLTAMMPSIRNNRTANRVQIARMKGIMQRVQDYSIARTRAVENGEGSQFMADWSAYTNSVPAGGADFETWRNGQPTFDKDGNPVRK